METLQETYVAAHARIPPIKNLPFPAMPTHAPLHLALPAQAWMHMYELRGLPLSSVVFIAWTTLAARAVECGHMHEFRRLLMQPVYAHVHYAVKHYNDSDDLDNLCMVWWGVLGCVYCAGSEGWGCHTQEWGREP